MEQYLVAGMIRNVHGVKGDLTVECLCDSTQVFASLKTLYLKRGGAYHPYNCTRNQPMNSDTMLVHLNGVESREEGVILKGQPLYADRNDLPALPEGSYFIADLLGLPVIDAKDGTVYGKITDVKNYGASDLYEVTGENGKVSLIPAVPEFISQVDLEKGIFVMPIEGMFS